MNSFCHFLILLEPQLRIFKEIFGIWYNFVILCRDFCYNFVRFMFDSFFDPFMIFYTILSFVTFLILSDMWPRLEPSTKFLACNGKFMSTSICKKKRGNATLWFADCISDWWGHIFYAHLQSGSSPPMYHLLQWYGARRQLHVFLIIMCNTQHSTWGWVAL